MATEVKRRRGTTAEHSTFTGALGEVTVDTTKDTLVVHDNSQVGGFPLLREDFSNVPQLITFYEANVETLNFDTTYSDTGNEPQGGLYWNVDEKTLSLVTNGSTLELGHKTEVNVINNDPLQETILKGSVVSAYGSPGASGKISVKLFEAGTDDTKTILGILDEDIDYGFEGKAIVFGKIRKLDTDTPNWSAGDVLYASSTAGQLTNTQPTAGNVELPIAYVVTVHPNVGEIFVRITPIDENAYQPYDTDLSTLGGLSKADGNFIVGNGSAWVAESGATARTSLGLGNVENVALSTYTGQGGSLDNQYITNGAGYITGYTETDTLSDVTGRGASTTDTITLDKSSASSGYALIVSGSAQESIRFLHTGLTVESTGAFNIDAGANDDQDLNLNAGHIYLNNNTDVDGNLGVTGDVTGSNLAISNWNTAYGWGNHADAGYLTSLPTHNHNNLYYTELEINEFLDGTNAISGYNKSNWDTAFGWGNHADAGYITEYTETDPVFSASAASGITSGDIANWDSSYQNSLTGASFNTSTGVVTVSAVGGAYNTVSLDGRYYTESEVDTLLGGKDNYGSWSLIDGSSTSANINSGNSVTIQGGVGITTSLDAETKVLTITNSNTADITGVTAGSGLTGGGTSGTVTLSHADTSSQGSVNNSGGTVIQDVTLDTYGHVTGLTSYNLDGRYYTETEIGNFFGGTTAISGYNKTNWDSAYNNTIASASWNSTNGVITLTQVDGGFVTVDIDGRYLTSYTETDPVFSASAASGITSGNISNWNVAYNNHITGVGFSTTTGVLTLTQNDTDTLTVDLDGRYLTSYTETDPVFSASVASGITSTNISNWNSAYNNTVASASFNSTNGVLTLTQVDGGFVTVDLDGRYLTAETGDISEVIAGVGLSGGGSSGSVTLTLDFSELPSNPPVTIDTTDQLIWYETGSGSENRTDISSFPLSKFNNDAGFTSNVGDITGVTAGTGLSGGGTSGSVTLSHATTSTLEGTYGSTTDGTKIDSITVDAFGHVTAVSTGATGDITGVTAGTGLSGGGTSGTVTLNVSGLTVSEFAAASIQTGAEAFVDSDTVLMTAAAIQDKILSYGYTTAVGDITGVTAGTGLSGGGTSGTVTLNVSGLTTSEFSAATILNSAETFTSSDSVIMTSAAIESYVTGFGYTTNTGDITGVTAGSGISGGGTSGTVTISHADTSSQGSVNNSGGTVIQDVTLDTYGHVTGLVSYNLDGRYYTETEADSRFVNVTGDSMSGNLTISGTLSATVKSFNIEHPTQEGKRLVYGVLEGNEHAVFVRGRSQNKVIELPEEWSGLVDPESITVQLTSIGNPKTYYYKEYKNNKVYIGSSGLNWKYDYFYIVHATRIDVEPLEVVQDAY